MPLEHRVGDLFAQPDINVFAHQANIFCTFGAGIAKYIRGEFPTAYAADCATTKGDTSKLGTYTTAALPDGRIVLNCYTQTGLNSKERDTSYDLIDKLFRSVEGKIRAKNASSNGDANRELILGIPYKYGSDLAGGDWRIVEAIFRAIFRDSPVRLVIVRLPNVAEVL